MLELDQPLIGVRLFCSQGYDVLGDRPEPVGERLVILEPGPERGVSNAEHSSVVVTITVRDHQLSERTLLPTEDAEGRVDDCPVGRKHAGDMLKSLYEEKVSFDVANVQKLDVPSQNLDPPEVLREEKDGVVARILPLVILAFDPVASEETLL